MADPSKRIIIYTDGACTGNPGPGGYGVVLLCGPHRKELSQGFRQTTNNRMEMMAVIAGLQALKTDHPVMLHSDSKYVVDAVEKGWAARWRSKRWMRSTTERAANSDLWETLLQLCERREVQFCWVKGHSGNVENERCDRLAVAAAQSRQLLTDEGYELSRAAQGLAVSR